MRHIKSIWGSALILGALISTSAAAEEISITRALGGSLQAELPVEDAQELEIKGQPNGFSQHWQWSGDQLVHSNGKCLTAAPDALYQDGADVYLAQCNGSASQSWQQVGGRVDAQILNSGGLCLDVPGGISSLGVQLWTCNGNLQQKWNLLPRPDFRKVKIKSFSGKTVDTGDYIFNGRSVFINDDISSSSQVWHWNRGGNLVNEVGQCLAVKGDEQTINGGTVFMWDCNSTDSQRWIRNGSQIKSLSGLCLDIPGGQTANGVELQIWTCNGNEHQQWIIEDQN